VSLWSRAIGCLRKPSNSTAKIVSPLELEALERRLLLSGSHDEALIGAIASALDTSNASGLPAWTAQLNDSSILGRELAMVGNALVGPFNPRDVLNGLLPDLSEVATFGELETALDVAGIGVSNFADEPDDLHFDIRFQQTVSVSALPLATSFDDLDLDISGSMDLDVALDFQLTMGAFWSLDEQPVFYLEGGADTLTVTATATAISVDATGRLGFVEITIDSAAATMGAQFEIDLEDPGVSPVGEAPGRITMDELLAGPVTALVPAPSLVNVGVGPDLSLTITSTLIAGPDTLGLTWPDIGDASAVTATLPSADYEALALLSPETISAGLSGIATFLGVEGLMGSTFMGRALPIVGEALRDQLSLSSLFESDVLDRLGNFTTAQALEDMLGAVGPHLADVGVTVSGGELLYSLSYNKTGTLSVPMQLGVSDVLDLTIDADVGVDYAAAFGLAFGVDLAGEEFFVQTGQGGSSFALSVAVDITALSATASVGFLGVEVSNGAISLDAGIAADLTPPGDRLSLAQLTGGSLGDFIEVDFGGSASAAMELSSAMMPSDDGTLEADWPDLNNLSGATINAGDFADWDVFSGMTASSFTDGLDGLTTFSGLFAALEYLNGALALLGTDLNEYVDFRGLLDSEVMQLLRTITTDNPDEPPTIDLLFVNSDSLLERLRLVDPAATGQASATGIEYSVAFTRHFDFTSPQLRMGTDLLADAFEFELNATADIDVDLTAALTFGVLLDGTFYLNAGSHATDPSHMTASVLVDAPVEGSARLGFISVEMVGGRVKLYSGNADDDPLEGASLGINLIDPGTVAGDDRITFAELAGGDLDSLVSVDWDGRARAEIPLRADLLPETMSPGDELTMSLVWDDALRPEMIQILGGQIIGSLTRFRMISPGMILEGLKRLADQATSWLGPDRLGFEFPLIGRGLAGLLDLNLSLGSFIGLFDGIGDFFTLQDLLGLITGGLGLGDGILTIGEGDFRFDVTLHDEYLDQLVDVGISHGLSYGPSDVFSFDLNSDVRMDVVSDVNLTFGVRFGVSDPMDAVFIVPTERFVQVGLGIEAGGPGSVAEIFGGVDANLTDPDGGRQISIGELAREFDTVVDVQPAMEVNLAMPLTVFLAVDHPEDWPSFTTSFEMHWRPLEDSRIVWGPWAQRSHNAADAFTAPALELGEVIGQVVKPVLETIQTYFPIPPEFTSLLNTNIPFVGMTIGDYLRIPKPLQLLMNMGSMVGRIGSLQSGSPSGGDSWASIKSELENTYGLNFPILQSSSLIQLMLGQNVDLVIWDPLVFESSAGMSQRFHLYTWGIPFLAGVSIDVLLGNLGDDTSHGRTGGDEIHGGPGADTLNGGGGADMIFGADGADVIDGGDGSDTLHGADGADTIHGDRGNDVIHAGQGDNVVHAYAGHDRITAGSGADEIYAGHGDDTIDAGDGDNLVVGDLGSEQITTGSGADIIYATGPPGGAYPDEPAAHTIVSGGGNDTIYGSVGPDDITAGSGDDEIRASHGPNVIDAGSGADTVYTGRDADTIHAGTGDDGVWAGDGDNVVHGDPGRDTITTGAGADLVFGGDDNDVITSTAGGDRLYGDGGDDEIFGGSDDDLLVVGAGSDTIHGQAGRDRVYGRTDSVTVDDNAADYLYGGTEDDRMYGGGGDDEIHGNEGDDLIHGDAGSDLMFGEAGSGADRLYGQGGDDLIHGEGSADTLLGGPGNDEVYGQGGADHIYGGDGADLLHGDADSDVIYGGDDADEIYGGDQDDLIFAGLGNDDIHGQGGADRIYAGDGDDTATGGPADDVLFGEGGGDELYGNEGDDLLDGGAGVDTLRGGEGNDRLLGGTGVGDQLFGEAGDDEITGSDEGGEDADFGDAVYFGDVIDGGEGRATTWTSAAAKERCLKTSRRPRRHPRQHRWIRAGRHGGRRTCLWARPTAGDGRSWRPRLRGAA